MQAPPDTTGATSRRPSLRMPLLSQRPACLLIVGAMLLGGPVRGLGQESSPSNLTAPVLETTVPERITTRAVNPVGHLHLQGTFPEPSYRLLSRLAVWVSGSNHSCRLAWSDDAITALMTGSGQPWLSLADLIDASENRAREACGTIDAVWAHRLEISIVHPRLLLPGALRLGVALYPPPPSGLQPASTGQPAESWIDVPVVRPFRVVGRTPRTPVVRGGDLLRITFAVTGDPPVRVTLGEGPDSVPLPFDVLGDRVEVTIPPQHYEAPTALYLRLSNGIETAQVSVPVCLGAISAAVVCPPS